MYAYNGTQRLYYEVEGSGPAVVLLHGFGETGRGWYEKGIVDALARHCTLVLMDARGHGRSDKPHDAGAYSIDRLVGDVLAVLDAVSVERAGVLGYSQGGWIALGLAACARDRVDRIAVGGATPYGQDLSQYRALCGMGLAGALAALEKANGEPFSPALRGTFMANDTEALSAAYANDRPDISAGLEGFDLQALLFAGEADPLLADMERLATNVPGASCLMLPGLNHVQGALRVGTLAEDFRRFFVSRASNAGRLE